LATDNCHSLLVLKRAAGRRPRQKLTVIPAAGQRKLLLDACDGWLSPLRNYFSPVTRPVGNVVLLEQQLNLTSRCVAKSE